MSRSVLVALAMIVAVCPAGRGVDRERVLGSGSLRASVTPRGARLSLGGHDATLAVATIGRRGAASAEIRREAPSGSHGEVRTALGPSAFEWWRTLPEGLEHGVTIEERAPGVGELRVELEVTGTLAPHLRSTDAVELRDGDGTAVATYARFVAVDADGARLPGRLAVAHGRIVLAVDDAAARYPLVLDPIVAAQEALLTASDGTASDTYGAAIALSADGSRALVGVPNDATFTGSVRVLVRTGSTWTEEVTLVAPDGGGGDQFGSSVSLSADGARALVGAPSDSNPGGVRVGSARTFVRSGTTWAYEATLFASGAAVNDAAGTSVALSADGSRAAVGVPADDTPAGVDSGSVRIFVRSGTAWTQEALLQSADAMDDDRIGASVAISSDGGRVLVGAARDDAVGADSGSASVFVRAGTAWTEEATLVAADTAAGDWLGTSVALSAAADRALVGAPHDRTTTGTAGSARVFVRIGTAWTHEAILTDMFESFADRLGSAVALSSDGRRALVGTPTDDAGVADAGSARLFLRTGTTWAREPLLTAPSSEAEMGDELGRAVALSGDGSRAAVGAPLDDTTGGMNAGSVRVFTLLGTTGSPCGDDAACSSGFCADGVCCGTRCGGDCEACSAALTGGTDGTCALHSAAVAPTVTCRAAVSTCDVAEVCTSTSAACPSDAFAGAATVCRASMDDCDVPETCTGTSSACPADLFAASTVVCRPPVTACDGAESCTGLGAACPPNAAAPTGTVCRPEAGPCDSAEVCDGSSFTCPGDVFEPMGNVCGTGMGDCALPATCTGTSSACPSTGARPAGTPCRPAASPCDVADVCDGTSQLCTDAFAPDTTLCGTAPTDVCDAPDHCAGTSADCVDVFLSGTECRASGGSCDLAEYCAGSAATCPPDAISPAGTACRVATDPLCDPEEVCDGTGTSCPADVTTCGTDAGGADAGVRVDAATPAVDAGPDAGEAPVTSGCACRVTSGSAPRPVLAVLVALALSARRRRRRPATAC